MKEIWVDIFEGFYSVSNLGQVRSNDRVINTKCGPKLFKGRILKPETTKDGHLRVVISNSQNKIRKFVHRLVAECFIPNPNKYPIINHKDENPANNQVNNLEWCTYSYNNNYNNRNIRVGDSEGIDIDVFDEKGNYIESFPSISKAARKYNISLTTLWRKAKNKKLINGYYFVIK